MACDFSIISPNISCDNSGVFFNVAACLKDTTSILQKFKISSRGKIILEYELILMRSGFLPDLEKFGKLDICNEHREHLGMK